MKEIIIGKTHVLAKDYECSCNGVYYPKEEMRLWLYINLTDACAAACPFCVHAQQGQSMDHQIDLTRLNQVLREIAPMISGISLTGGEPMTDTLLLEQTLHIIRKTVPLSIEVDLVTNGFQINKLPNINGIDRLATIHISRHAVDDKKNASLMSWPDAPTKSQLQNAISLFKDPGITVLNCVLQQNGVHDLATVIEYLEMAAEIGAANVSLIGMFMANDFCRDQYISPADINFFQDHRFTIWNHFYDHEYCQCCTGDYHAKAGYIRFYFRSPGLKPPVSYCRQLVYGTDNILRQGFGNAPIVEI